ncbi:putative RNA recognition motif domain, nucleotide-binding alpha-beta plait domain superfamily [Helianthus anomalus]
MTGQVVKFFVSNIPDGCRPWDLATQLKEFGEVSATYIARKRDNDGLKFSFVSFKGVRVWKELERRLKRVKLGMNSLKINLARLAKENGFVESARNDDDSGQQELKMGEQEGMKVNLGFQQMNGGYTRPGCSYSVEVSTMGSRHGRAILGRVRNFNTLISLKKIMAKAGGTKVEYQYVGGYNMLVVFEEESAAVAFLSREVEWKDWFSHANMWVGHALAFERVAWLRIHGVSLHLYCDKMFYDIGSRFGVVAKHPEVTEDDGNLSMVCVEVLLGDGKRIIEEVVLKWQDKRYRVWVSEDLGDWFPDCLDEDANSVTSDDGDSAMGSEYQTSEVQAGLTGNQRDGAEEPRSCFGKPRVHGEVKSVHVQTFSAGNYVGESSMHEDKRFGGGDSSKNVGQHGGGAQVVDTKLHAQKEGFGNQDQPTISHNEEREEVGTALSNGLEADYVEPRSAENRPSYITFRPKRDKKNPRRRPTLW